jgi:hypothetical protein
MGAKSSLQQSTHFAVFIPMSTVVGPVERHHHLAAVRSIAWDFQKYKDVSVLAGSV